MGVIACKPDRTLFVDPIRASSLNRLHQQAGQTTAPDGTPDHHFTLATREPSTEDSLKIRQDRDLLPANIGIPCVPKVTGS